MIIRGRIILFPNFTFQQEILNHGILVILKAIYLTIYSVRLIYWSLSFNDHQFGSNQSEPINFRMHMSYFIKIYKNNIYFSSVLIS